MFAEPATRPTQLERERSLADELFEVDPSLKATLGKSDSFHKHINIESLEDDDSANHHVEVEPCSSSSITPPDDNEPKVKAEELTAETPDKDRNEFCDTVEFIDDEPQPQGCLNDTISISVSGTAKRSKALLSSRNVLLEEASSPEEEIRIVPGPSYGKKKSHCPTPSTSSEAGAHG